MSSPTRTPVVRHTITIALADDHHLVRSGLRLLLESEDGLTVVADAADTDGALRIVGEHKPAILLFDLNMPGTLTSMETIAKARKCSPGTAIVVLTMHDDPAFARHALGAGATGYVLKEASDGELVDVIRGAVAGETYLAPRLGAAIATAPPASPGPAETLSARELEVLRLIALGHTNAEIGERLGLSTRTVESHRGHIQQKLGRSTRAELVRYALDHRLLAG